MQGLAHHPRREHVVGRHLAAEHGVGVFHAVAAVLHDDRGEMLLGDTRLAHEPLGPQREVRGCGGEAGFLAPRLEERRADDPLRHLLDAVHEHGVVLAGSDRACREHERGATARAPGFHVDDRHAGHAHRVEHLVARGDARVHGAAERGLEAAATDAGIGERLTHRDDAHLGDRRALEPSEGMQPDARDVDGAHRSAPTIPTIPQLGHNMDPGARVVSQLSGVMRLPRG